MDVIRETPGPRIGFILHALLEEVLDDTDRNNEKYLENRAKELAKLNDEDLLHLGRQGKERVEKEEAEAIKEIHDKYWVS